MILVRTTPEALASASSLGDRLAAASGLAVAMLIDERRAPAGECRHAKIGLTRAGYADLGLHMPPDVGWRCGDYGLYAARHRYPQIEHFWLFEDDVRVTGDAERLFRISADLPELDLMVARLAPARADWWWWPHLSSSDAPPWRCFFPVMRISARALDTLHAIRRKHSGQLSRKALWPNDEAFVATTVVHQGFARADLNDVCPALYDDATFSYDNLLRADVDDRGTDGPPRLLHPVLGGEAYARKAGRKAASHRPPSLAYLARRTIARRVNSLRRW
jgi:hypothetical protein